MTILYLHQYFNTPSMPGSTRSYEFARRLVSRGDVVHMITSNWQGKSKSSFSIEKGINVYWAPLRYSNKMNFTFRIFAFIKYLWFVFTISRRLKFDLIIASSTPLTVVIPAIWLKKIKNVKLVLEIRDLWPQLPIAIGALKSSLIIKLSRLLELKAYFLSDKIIALSTGMELELKANTSIDKVSVITNISDIDRFNVDPEMGINFRRSIPISNDSPLIVYTGSFGRINGLSYLIEIAKEMKLINNYVKFLLVGDGHEKEKIIKQAKGYQLLNDNVIIMNYLPKEQMPNVLSAATITTSFFINLPEMENNSANKFFDGLAAKRPVIINYGGWQAKLLNKYKAGLVIPKNEPKKAAKILNDLLINKNMLEKMRKASSDLALQFDVITNYEKFKKVIDDAYQS